MQVFSKPREATRHRTQDPQHHHGHQAQQQAYVDERTGVLLSAICWGSGTAHAPREPAVVCGSSYNLILLVAACSKPSRVAQCVTRRKQHQPGITRMTIQRMCQPQEAVQP